LFSCNRSEVLSAFRNCRLELGKLFALLPETLAPTSHGNGHGMDLNKVLHKLAHHIALDTASTSATVDGAAAAAAGEVATATATATAVAGGKTPQQIAARNAVETSCAWVQFACHLPLRVTMAALPASGAAAAASSSSGLPQGLAGLLDVVVVGTGHSEAELAGICAETAFLAVQTAASDRRLPPGISGAAAAPTATDAIAVVLAALTAQRAHPSFHVRQVHTTHR
jgi:hypothetical protein